jgi:MFS transporter, SP family, inositol transporter
MIDQSRKLDSRYWRLAVAGGMASYLDSGVLISAGISLAIWKEHFGLDPWMLGFISAGLGLAVAVGALFGGRIADLFGRTRVFNIDVFIYVIGIGLIAFAANSTMLIIGVMIAGVAAGADLPTSIAVIAERAPEGAQGRLVAFTQVMWTVGIVVSTLLGFLVANLDMTGVRILFLHLFAAGLATGLIRVLSPSFKRLEAETLQRSSSAEAATAMPLRQLLTTRYFTAGIALTGLFYVFYGLVANTIGQFKTYFLVTVGDASQSTATGFSFVALLIGLACSLLLTRLVDTQWRRPLFVCGNLLLISGLVLTAVTGGENLALMFVFLVIYNLSNPFCGEALYKVWTQESFPVNARATAQGLTYGVARLIFAAFALVTPAMIDWNPSGLFWILSVLAAVSGLLGLILARRGQTSSTRQTREPAST